MRIGIDVDGVVYPWSKAVNEALADEFDVEGLIEHTHWDYLRDTISDAQWKWVWSRDAVSRVYGRYDLIYAGCHEIVQALIDAGNEIHFVTHRVPEIAGAYTHEYLDEWFHGYKGVHILDRSLDRAAAKAALGTWDAFIEDHLDTIHALHACCPIVLAPHRPWNEGAECIRFLDWASVPELLIRTEVTA